MYICAYESIQKDQAPCDKCHRRRASKDKNTSRKEEYYHFKDD